MPQFDWMKAGGISAPASDGYHGTSSSLSARGYDTDVSKRRLLTWQDD